MIDTNQNQEIEFAAFVGIDWADQKHAWALQIPGHGEVERGDLDHTPEAVEAWAAELGRRFGGHPIAVALEQSRGSLLFMLTKYAHLVLFPVHPTTLSDYRKGFRPSGAKSDPSDAGLLVDLLVRHREKLRRLNPDTQQTRTLQFLVEARRKFVNDKTRYSNRLTAYLKMYFPQVLDWFSEVTSPRHFDARLLRRGQPGVDSSRRNCRTAAAKIGVGKNAGEEAGSGFPFEGMLPARML